MISFDHPLIPFNPFDHIDFPVEPHFWPHRSEPPSCAPKNLGRWWEVHTLTMLPHLSTFEISRPNPFTSQARPIAARASEACWTNQACFFFGAGRAGVAGWPGKTGGKFSLPGVPCYWSWHAPSLSRFDTKWLRCPKTVVVSQFIR